MFFYAYIDFERVRRSPSTSLRIDRTNTHYVVHNQDDSILIRLRGRQSYPVTYAKYIDKYTVHLGYGVRSTNLGDDQEFLQLVIKSDGTLSITRDSIITLPLFYSYSPKLFVASNVYEAVIESLDSATVNMETLFNILHPSQGNAYSTLLREVVLLGERQRLIVDKRGHRIVHAEDRPRRCSRESIPQKATTFRRVFEEHLDSFVRQRLVGQSFAFEVSGGLDSSVLPLYMSRRYAVKSPLIGLGYPGQFGVTQDIKLQALSSYTGYPLTVIPMGENSEYPLSRMIAFSDFQPMHGQEEIYMESFMRLADRLQDLGVKVLCTGIGGDDILENITDLETHYGYGAAERQRRQSDPIPIFLTDTFREAYVAYTRLEMSFPIPLLPLSTLNPEASNNIYIERDIWPVSPFLQPSLYNFCQGLPAYLRANKNIVRAWFQAHNYPEVIYNPKQNEDFSEVFTQTVLSSPYAATFERYAHSSITARLGLVDAQLLMHTFRSLNEHTADHFILFRLYSWLCLEIALQHTAGLQMHGA